MSNARADQLFLAYIGRPADVGWRNSTANLLTSVGPNAAPSVALQNAFFAASVLEGVYSLSDSNATLVNKIFLNLFGFGARTDEQAFWGSQITSGFMTQQTAAWTIFSSYFANLDTLPAQYTGATYAKLVAIDKYSTQLLSDSAANLAVSQIGGAGATSARTFLSSVTNQATAATAITNIATAVNNATTAASGTTYTLAASADNIPGTSSNDTITGLVSETTGASTLSASDVINGGAGTDTFNITFEGNPTAVPGAQISGVEVFNLRAIGTAAVSVDASNFSGATQVWSDRATRDVTVTNLAAGAAGGIRGNGSVESGAATALTFGYAAGVTAGVLAVDGGVKGANAKATATGSLESLTIASTGAANTLAGIDTGAGTVKTVTIAATTNLTTGNIVDVAAGTTITVSGLAATVGLGTLAANVKSVDATGLTAGGVTAVLDAATATFTGGGGVDTVTTVALTTTTAGVINAGAGAADVLIVANGDHVDSATEAALYTNFEVLRNSGTTDLDVSLLSGITSVQLGSANAGATKLTAAQAANVRVLVTNTTNTVSLATATGTTDVLGLTYQPLAAADVATAIDVTALTATGFETVNVVSSAGSKAGGTGVGNDLGFAAAAAGDLTAINVSGEYDLTIAAANITKAVTITSTQTGTAALYASGNFANGSSVTGSGGADAFILGTGFATYNGGAGNDTFNGTAAQLNTGPDYNVISGGDGSDTLNITGGVALNIVDNNLSKLTGVEKIIIATTAANNQSIQTGGFFDAAFKTTGVDLTTTSTTGTITIDATSFSGAATFTTTSTDGNQNIQTGTSGGNDKITATAGKGTVTVTTAAGDDVVSVTTAGTGGTEGTITVNTGAGNDTITIVNAGAGGAAAITAGAGADKITLGVDTAVLTIGNSDSGSTVTLADTITGFKTTNDQLKLGFAGGGTNATEAAAVVADFATAQTNANAALNTLRTANPGSTELANFQWDATNGYLFNDTNADGTADQVIVLVGINGATFAVADIVA
jgi:hypothetical protein